MAAPLVLTINNLGTCVVETQLQRRVHSIDAAKQESRSYSKLIDPSTGRAAELDDDCLYTYIYIYMLYIYTFICESECLGDLTRLQGKSTCVRHFQAVSSFRSIVKAKGCKSDYVLDTLAPFMVVVGNHFTFLLVVVWWDTPTELLDFF